MRKTYIQLILLYDTYIFGIIYILLLYTGNNYAVKSFIPIQARREKKLDIELVFFSWYRQHENNLWNDFLKGIRCSKEIPELVVITESESVNNNTSNNDCSETTNQSIRSMVFLQEIKDINEIKNVLKPRCRRSCKCTNCEKYKEYIVPVVEEEIRRRKLFFANLLNIVSNK
jgi:hypothetical protein